MESFYVLFLYFCICAFIGWVIESSYKTIYEKKFVNSGFLYGPFTPIYGFVALAIYFCSVYLQGLFFPFLLIIYFLIPLIVEYFTSWIIEKIFRIKFWDYSDHKFNFNGRICLSLSLAWFAFVLFAVFVIQPFILTNLKVLPQEIVYWLSWGLIIYFAIDLILSIRMYYYFYKIKNKLVKLVKSRTITDVDKFLSENQILKRIRIIMKPIKSFPSLRKGLHLDDITISKILKSVKKRKLHKKL